MPSKYLTREQILAVLKKLDAHAKRLGVEYCVIGGALFKLLGIPGYETKDIDIAATDYLDLPTDDSAIKNVDFKTTPREERSVKGDGHYTIDGVNVDWMPRGKIGSDRLFQRAVESSEIGPDGFRLARLSLAIAIKLYAGREQDKECYDEFLDNRLIDGDEVKAIVKECCQPEDEPLA